MDRVGLISCCENERVAFLLSQPNTDSSINSTGKYVASVEFCRNSGQPWVWDFLLEWFVAYSRMSKSWNCCRPSVHNFHTPHALKYTQRCDNQSGYKVAGVTRCYSGIFCLLVVGSQLQTLKRVLQECKVAAWPQTTMHRGLETHLHVQPLLH